MMFERLSEFVNRHEELSLLINDPDIIADQGKWRGLMKEYSDITPIAEKYTEYKNTQKNISTFKDPMVGRRTIVTKHLNLKQKEVF